MPRPGADPVPAVHAAAWPPRGDLTGEARGRGSASGAGGGTKASRVPANTRFLRVRLSACNRTFLSLGTRSRRCAAPAEGLRRPGPNWVGRVPGLPFSPVLLGFPHRCPVARAEARSARAPRTAHPARGDAGAACARSGVERVSGKTLNFRTEPAGWIGREGRARGAEEPNQHVGRSDPRACREDDRSPSRNSRGSRRGKRSRDAPRGGSHPRAAWVRGRPASQLGITNPVGGPHDRWVPRRADGLAPSWRRRPPLPSARQAGLPDQRPGDAESGASPPAVSRGRSAG